MSTKPQARYQCVRIAPQDGQEHVQSMIGAQFVRVIAPGNTGTYVELAYIGAGQFHIHASGRLFVSADSSSDLVVRPQRFSSHAKRKPKNVARKG